MTKTLFDQRSWTLDKGPLGHPKWNQSFWFDIIIKKMTSRVNSAAFEWQFDHHGYQAGWISRGELLIASKIELFRFNVAERVQSHVVSLDTENSITRSNYGRVDPWDGFWTGTMGKNVEFGAGVIYRFYCGAVDRLYSEISIANSICFLPIKTYAYYTDTLTA